MIFPYPQNPSDWQTAYTRDHAYKDSGKHAKWSNLAVLAGIPFLWGYIIIRVAPYLDFKALPLYIWVAIAVLLVAIIFLVFLVVQSGAFRFASGFLIEFYRPPEGIDPMKIINNRLNGVLKFPPPLNLFFQFQYIIARDGEIIKSDKWPAWSARYLGGPILLIVFDGCALYLERGNRFSRVVGPGDKVPFLEWHETIKYVVDLRPKVKDGSFDVWTKDGININLKIQIECCIGDPKKKDPNTNLVYPYDPMAVKKAIERHSIRWPTRLEGEPSEFTWIDAAWGQVTGIVPSYIGSRVLDDLFIADRNSGQILSPNATHEIFDKLNNATKGFGVFITDFQVLEIAPPEEVKNHQKEHWKAERQSIATIRDGQSKAFNIRSHEKARADAQRDLILAIADGLEKNKDGKYAEPLLLSLSGILDNSLKDPLLRAYLAKEALDALEKIQNMLE